MDYSLSQPIRENIFENITESMRSAIKKRIENRGVRGIEIQGSAQYIHKRIWNR